ncbi:LacI family DNA-binding transcriptional regulator [Virgibacillus salexigens]|uniref:LacI family DNA-binding transcriptional regulator n=1 Tax=Virgibacillus massiliensis TaxID=1462526 RepID=UPI00136E7089|nr:LacI family DNA-binding transcriptional regulator [Virgibacillus massiliensis]MYL41280.1 LacI family DNA-binding transcriptional regulator [Virgibacillus massiliensis]
MAVTLKDIARECGVSYSTVSKALKDSPLVTEATKRKIKEKAEQMNYIPNNSARSLVSNRSNTIGLIWPAVDRVAITTLASQINQALKKEGYFMVVSIEDPITAAQKFLELRFDGVIVFDEGEHTTLPTKITKNIPVVAYGVERELDYPIINVNHDLAMKQAIDALIHKGYHQVDYFGDLHTNDIRQIVKKDTFIRHCKQRRITYRMVDSGGLSEESASRAMKSFLANHDLNEGVVCGSYDITMGLLHHVKDTKQTPMIFSYDHIDQFNSIDTPVHSVGVPSQFIAQKLVDVLVDTIETNKVNRSVIQLKPQINYR